MNPLLEKNKDSERLIPNARYKIKPSSFSKFFINSYDWYRENILDEKLFKGNTASELGTIVHYGAEMFAKGEKIKLEYIEEFIDSLKDNEDVDIEYIRRQYKPMIEALVNQYLIKEYNKPKLIEEYIHYHFGNDIYFSGYLDAGIVKDNNDLIIVDYKTTSQLSPKSYIPNNYYEQLMLYAYILKRTKNYENIKIRIVYISNHQINRVSEKTGKPLKDYPSTVSVIEQNVTDEDYDYIDNRLNILINVLKQYDKAKELNNEDLIRALFRF